MSCYRGASCNCSRCGEDIAAAADLIRIELLKASISELKKELKLKTAELDKIKGNVSR